HAALAEGLGDALVDAVDRAVGDLPARVTGKELGQAPPHAGFAERILIGLADAARKDRAPDAGLAVALDLEEVAPLLRVGEVVADAIAAAGRQEVEGGADLDEFLRVGETLEGDV